jgi:hypothetical protein
MDPFAEECLEAPDGALIPGTHGDHNGKRRAQVGPRLSEGANGHGFFHHNSLLFFGFDSRSLFEVIVAAELGEF